MRKEYKSPKELTPSERESDDARIKSLGTSKNRKHSAPRAQNTESAAVQRAFRYANSQLDREEKHGKVLVIVKDGVPQV